MSEKKDKHKNSSQAKVWIALTYCDDQADYNIKSSTIKWRLDRLAQVEKYAFIFHDRDIWTTESLDISYPVDETGERPINRETGLPFRQGDHKKAHYHIAIWLNVRWRKNQLATVLDIPERFFMNMDSEIMFLSYLTHRLNPEKTPYYEEEVISNFDWISLRDGSPKLSEIEQILKRVELGELTRNNYTRLLDMKTCIKYDSQLKKAFDIYDDKHKHDKLIRTNIYVQPIVVEQGSGVGKSLISEEWYKTICDTLNWDYCFANSGKDMFGSYSGQECIIFDDRSFNSFSRDDFLNTFDINNKGDMPSRFKDKSARWRGTIVTNINDFEDEIKKIKGFAKDEDLTQVRRRFKYIIKISQEFIHVYEYNSDTKQHELTKTAVNWIYANIIDREKYNHEIENQDIMFISALAKTLANHRKEFLQRNQQDDVKMLEDMLSIEDKTMLLEYLKKK